ncbi:hypothetical protein [Petroclostridium xylanilyticum]|jgi:hypothetical protein|uniref:hypothetical protein n=1 Tax=Petroclostridium xylanilyticum TaxID=1792311 RepID=UPI000B992C19|nr:hypothetical protein [Petroclostridium xylanilyticum]
MGLLDFLNSELKINTSINDSIKNFTIIYPKKKGSIVPIGVNILQNILKYDSIIVHIDTSLCFNTQLEVKNSIDQFRNTLSALAIDFEYRTFKASNAGPNILGIPLQSEKRQEVHQIITFGLKQHFDDKDFLTPLLQIGCQIYVPYEQQFDPKLIQRVFNGHFQEEHDKVSTFKYVLFINDFIGQTVIKTKSLELKDIEEICAYK